MPKNIYLRIIICLYLLILSSNVLALNIQVKNFNDKKPSFGFYLLLEGKIEEGDAKNLIQYIKNIKQLPSSIKISSEGGDLIEAMKIGQFIRSSLFTVWVGGNCQCSCRLDG